MAEPELTNVESPRSFWGLQAVMKIRSSLHGGNVLVILELYCINNLSSKYCWQMLRSLPRLFANVKLIFFCLCLASILSLPLSFSFFSQIILDALSSFSVWFETVRLRSESVNCFWLVHLVLAFSLCDRRCGVIVTSLDSSADDLEHKSCLKASAYVGLFRFS